MGDSGLEILHGGVGGDVEQGARTSKHILVFAFDPLSLQLSLFTFVLCIASFLLSYHSYLFACVVPCICVILLYLVYAWLFVCASLVPNQQELHIAPQPIQGESRGVSPEPFTGNSATLIGCIKFVQICLSFHI